MGFFAAIVVALVMAVVGELLRPKQKPQNAKPSSLDDFDIPTAEEGRSVPIIAGKVKIDGSNCTWYGDLATNPIKKKIKTGWFSKTTQIIGYRYKLGMQLVLCHGRPDLQIHEIRFGDKMPKHTRLDEGDGCTKFTFVDENFYGGPEKEGGITGIARFYHGVDAQQSNDYMSAQLEEHFPAYKNITHCILEHMYLGTSAYIKPIGFIVSSYPNQLGVPDDHHIIGEDCNPICFIYELMTDQVWGVGMGVDDIDIAKFIEVAEIIYAEGYGMSMLYNGGSTAKEMIGEILRHIDGVMFSDPQTGLVTVRLARADYDVNALPVLGRDQFQEGIKFSRPSWSETKNTIKSTYVDREADYNVVVCSQQDLANIAQRGGEISMEELDFTGFTSYQPAALATARALKTLSYPLAKVAGTLDRTYWKMKPADVFVLNWPERGIESLVMRVIRVNYANLSRNLIDIEAVEDIFAVSRIAYVQPDPSGWENPVGSPGAMTRQDLVEAPAFNAPGDAKYVITLGSKEGGADVAYDVVVDPAGGTAYEYTNSVETMTPSAVLYNDFLNNTAYESVGGFVVANMIGADLLDAGSPDGASRREGHNLAIIGNEWVAWKSFFYDPGTERYSFFNVLRGVLDTVPEDHFGGDRVWFVSEGAGLAGEDGYAEDVTLGVKLLPRTIREALDAAEAVGLTITTNSRAARPLPPGDPKIGASRFVDVSAASNQFTVSWKHRNRFHNVIESQGQASITPEEGTLYNIRLVNDDTDVLIYEREDMNATTATVTLSAAANVRLELRSNRNGLESWQAQTAVFAYTPSGAVANTIIPDEPTYILDGGGA